MSQNSERMLWSAEVVDNKLREIMGANAMLAQGF